MGGDSPLDYLSDLAEAVGLKFDRECSGEEYREKTFHGFHFTREILESNMDAVKKSLRKNKGHVYGQVVGATFLWAGAEMPEELKSRVIEDANKDEWAAEGDAERRHHIRDFIEKIENHKAGERMQIAEEGLFQKFAEAMGGVDA